MFTKRSMVLILAVVFSLTAILAGCGVSTTPTEKTSSSPTTAAQTTGNEASKLAPVDLKWYTIGDGQPVDTDLVLADLNKKLKDKINATVSLNVIDWNSYAQKIAIMSSAGEAFDLCFSSGWTDFYNMAAKGYFADMTELLPQYAPKSKELINNAFLDAFTVKGKILATANLQGITYKDQFLFNKDIADKYKVPSKVNSIEELEPFFDAIKKGEPSLKYIFYAAGKADTSITYFYRGGKNIDSPVFDVSGAFGLVKVKLADGTVKIMPNYETQQLKDTIAWHRKAFNSGWIPKDVATLQFSKDLFKNGQAACVYLGLNPDKTKTEGDWGKNIYPVDIGATNWITSDMVSGSATSISYNSNNKERAMMLIDLVNSDPEILNNMILGVEGKHWVRKDNNQWDYFDGVDETNSGYKMTAYGWALGNDFLKFTKVGTDPNTVKSIQEFDAAAKVEPAVGFVPDLTPYKTQIANMASVNDELLASLTLGMVDPDKYLPQYKTKIDKAGINDVVAGVQKQLDDYVAANK